MIYTRQDHIDAWWAQAGCKLFVPAALVLLFLWAAPARALADGPPFGTPPPWWMPQWLAELLGYGLWVILGVEG